MKILNVVQECNFINAFILILQKISWTGDQIGEGNILEWIRNETVGWNQIRPEIHFYLLY